METTTRLNRIHPLMAAAAVSVVIVSLTGAAAITGLLPNSNSAPDVPANQLAAASPYGVQAPLQQPGMVPVTTAQGQVVMVPAAAVQGQVAAAPLSATPVTPQLATQLAAGPAPQMAMPVAAAQPIAYAQPVAQPAPAPERVVVKEVIREKPVVKVVEKTRVVHAKPSEPRYYPQQAPAPAQPNYVGIGTGAVIGGLIGNQIGGGNGKKLATVAGIIGGGMLGNEIANRNR
ncbi:MULTISPECIES: glycine zipper 2TM domain-containing protein [Massilia]|uniref:glycine zipper 2TM domain-containing protein n=1 Tax=Massilia TaxID=149698 RepID=UPI0004E41037|nr:MULTISPECIES: glycine zipper 2TM domain-containing protein [Massilia]KFC63030.1 17 kDa surface antigen [Massilia sp. LC238]